MTRLPAFKPSGHVQPVNDTTGPSLSQISAAQQAAATAITKKTRRHRMRFKNCGVRASKALFLSLSLESDKDNTEIISDSLLLDGVITAVPKKSSKIM